jgi:lipopolysaccharide transport protein LptA
MPRLFFAALILTGAGPSLFVETLLAETHAEASATAIQPADTLKPVNPLPPIVVESDSFRVLLRENKAVWRGNVIATQGNFNFRASQLTIHLDQIASDAGNASTSSDKGEHAVSYELSARTLSYDLDTDRIIGDGDSQLRRGQEMIRADRITYEVARRVATAYPDGGGRVHVQFMTNPEKPVFPAASPKTLAFAAK